jgi:hypothetical protein
LLNCIKGSGYLEVFRGSHENLKIDFNTFYEKPVDFESGFLMDLNNP